MASYVIGQHGAKCREQRRLTELYGERVTGRTHESEHTIGFAPLNETSGIKRGGSKVIRQLEKDAWAYQEHKPMHRAHIGTGTQNDVDPCGFNSDSYRTTQRSLVEAGNVSSAVQVNQLAYAFLPGFQNSQPSTRLRIADDSFRTMVQNMDRVHFATESSFDSRDVSKHDRLEMYLSRLVARGEGEGPSGWPSDAQITEAKRALGI